MIFNAKAAYDRQRLNLNLPSKQLWNNVKNLGISAKNFSSVVCEHSMNSINDYFSSNFSALGNERIQFSSNDNGFCFRPVFDYEIINAMFNIKSNATGFDGIPISFLRIIISYALPVFEHLFNSIISASEFPTNWKRTKVIPIYTKKQCKIYFEFVANKFTVYGF